MDMDGIKYHMTKYNVDQVIIRHPEMGGLRIDSDFIQFIKAKGCDCNIYSMTGTGHYCCGCVLKVS